VNLQHFSITQIRDYIEQLFPKDCFISSGKDRRYTILNDIIQHLETDQRKSAKELQKFACRIIEIQNKKVEHCQKMLVHERESGYRLIAGVDEAGRGPLAGPVVAASVILDPDILIAGIDDSKKLSEQKRESLYDEIQEKAIAVGIGVVNNETIDRINIFRASLEAMSQAVRGLSVQPDYLLIDGQHCPDLDLHKKAIVGGDGSSLSIAAASIIAKVTRDRIMKEFDKIYPHYRFSKNKGYPTPEHLSALQKFGPCDIHRRSYAPVAEVLCQKP
jgi:ribonuclease HII